MNPLSGRRDYCRYSLNHSEMKKKTKRPEPQLCWTPHKVTLLWFCAFGFDSLTLGSSPVCLSSVAREWTSVSQGAARRVRLQASLRGFTLNGAAFGPLKWDFCFFLSFLSGEVLIAFGWVWFWSESWSRTRTRSLTI